MVEFDRTGTVVGPWKAKDAFKGGHQMDGKVVIEHLVVEYNMFQSLIEQPPITQEVLTKLTGELLTRYETREVFTGGEFTSDLNHLSHQLRLYGEVLEQLSPHTLALRAFHSQLFRLADFLTRLATRTHQAPPYPLPPAAYCVGCSGLLEHRNIRQLHRELVNGQLIAVERSERSSEGSAEEEREELTQEELLVRRMGSLQQNITERQVNLVRCIDDFENMRSDMLVGVRLREFSRDFDSFDLKAYALQITTHFLSSLTRVEDKISRLKRTINVTSDQAVQTVLTNDAPPPPTRNEPKLQHNRSQADFRRVNDLKIRLQENCRRYQLELRETQSKVEVLEGQLKNLKEETANEKFRREAIEKAKLNAERDQKLREEERAKKENLDMLMSGEQSIAGEFESRFLQNYASNGSRRVSEEDMVPIIKATLKRTFEGFLKQRLSLNLNLSRLHHSPLPPTRQGEPVERRRMSRKKTIKMQMEEGTREVSRFAQKRNSSVLSISTQVNYKLMPRALLLAAPAHISSSNSAYKKSVLYTEGSVKRRRNHYSNLNSILSEFKENQRGHSNERSLTKKYSQTLQTELSELLVPPKKVQKGRKIQLSSNHSQLLDGKMVSAEMKEEKKKEGLRLEGVRLMISSEAVKQFLFLSELDHDPAPATVSTYKRDQVQLSIESLSSQNPLKKEKVILNLQEINYLTNFYSLLAKIHMVDADTYNKLKRWIFTKSTEKVEAGRHSLILKQIVSEIVFKHRECKLSSSSLCPHLSAFLQDLETTLRSVQAQT